VYVSSLSIIQLSYIFSCICLSIKLDFYLIIVFVCKQGLDEAAQKQRIKEEKEKEDDAAERDRQLRLAANEEATVSYVVDSSCNITHYVLPIA